MNVIETIKSTLHGENKDDFNLYSQLDFKLLESETKYNTGNPKPKKIKISYQNI